MNHTIGVGQIDAVDAIDRLPLAEIFFDRVKLLLFKHENRVESGLARLFELDRGGLVPNDIIPAEILDEHEHLGRVDGCVHASAEYRADIVARLPIQRKLDAHFTEIVGDSDDPRAGSAVCREKIKPPT